MVVAREFKVQVLNFPVRTVVQTTPLKAFRLYVAKLKPTVEEVSRIRKANLFITNLSTRLKNPPPTEYEILEFRERKRPIKIDDLGARPVKKLLILRHSIRIKKITKSLSTTKKRKLSSSGPAARKRPKSGKGRGGGSGGRGGPSGPGGPGGPGGKRGGKTKKRKITSKKRQQQQQQQQKRQQPQTVILQPTASGGGGGSASAVTQPVVISINKDGNVDVKKRSPKPPTPPPSPKRKSTPPSPKRKSTPPSPKPPSDAEKKLKSMVDKLTQERENLINEGRTIIDNQNKIIEEQNQDLANEKAKVERMSKFIDDNELMEDTDDEDDDKKIDTIRKKFPYFVEELEKERGEKKDAVERLKLLEEREQKLKQEIENLKNVPLLEEVTKKNQKTNIKLEINKEIKERRKRKKRNEKIEELEKKLTKAESENKQGKMELNQYKNQIVFIQNSLDTIKQEKEQLEKRGNMLMDESKDEKENIEELQTRLEEANNKLKIQNDNLEQIDILKDQLKKSKQAMEDQRISFEKTNNEIKGEVSQLQVKLSQSETKYKTDAEEAMRIFQRQNFEIQEREHMLHVISEQTVQNEQFFAKQLRDNAQSMAKILNEKLELKRQNHQWNLVAQGYEQKAAEGEIRYNDLINSYNNSRETIELLKKRLKKGKLESKALNDLRITVNNLQNQLDEKKSDFFKLEENRSRHVDILQKALSKANNFIFNLNQQRNKRKRQDNEEKDDLEREGKQGRKKRVGEGFIPENQFGDRGLNKVNVAGRVDPNLINQIVEQDPPALELKQQGGVPALTHQEQKVPALTHQKQKVPALTHQEQKVPALTHQEQKVPALTHQEQKVPNAVAGRAMEIKQEDDPALEFKQEDDPALEINNIVPADSLSRQGGVERASQHRAFSNQQYSALQNRMDAQQSDEMDVGFSDPMDVDRSSLRERSVQALELIRGMFNRGI